MIQNISLWMCTVSVYGRFFPWVPWISRGLKKVPQTARCRMGAIWDVNVNELLTCWKSWRIAHLWRDLSDVLVVSLLWGGAGAAVWTSGHVKVQGASWTLQSWRHNHILAPPKAEKLKTWRLWGKHHRTIILEILFGIFLGSKSMKMKPTVSSRNILPQGSL